MKAFKKFIAKINKSSFFSNKNYLHLREHVELIEQAFFFLQDYPDTPHDIMVLKSYGNKWYEIATQQNYIIIWSMLTFYRCIEKLKKAKDYFDLPVTDINYRFVAEYNTYKNMYYAKIKETLKKYEAHYHFSKIMWDKYNEICAINHLPSSENKISPQ